MSCSIWRPVPAADIERPGGGRWRSRPHSPATSLSSCSTAAPGAVLQRATQGLSAFEPGARKRGLRVAALSVRRRGRHRGADLEARADLPGWVRRDAPAIAALTGAFVNPDPVFLQSAGFVLDPAGNVVVSVYSSGANRAARPRRVIGLVRYLREHSPAAAAEPDRETA